MWIIVYLIRFFRRRRRAVRIVFTVDGKRAKKMNNLPDNRTLLVAITGEDIKANPAPLDPAAQPVWSVDQPSLATCVPSADGLSAVITPVGPLGSFNVKCSIGAINQEPAMIGTCAVTVVASAAVQIALSATLQ
jgi:hypothetical protein